MIRGINHITFSVSDLEQSFHFYADLLGLKPVARWYKGAHFLAGDLWVCLNLEAEIKDRPATPTYDHLAFLVTAQEFAPLVARLRQAGVVEWQQNHSEGDSFYFLDPDQHKLELHVTGLQERIASLQRTPPRDLILYD